MFLELRRCLISHNLIFHFTIRHPESEGILVKKSGLFIFLTFFPVFFAQIDLSDFMSKGSYNCRC